MKNKNIIKINNNQYIKVEKDNKIFLINKYENIFSKGHTENRVELVPKQEADLEKLSISITNLLEKISKNDFISNSADLGFSVSKIDALSNQVYNIKDVIKEEISKDRKYQENKDLIKSDLFSSFKEIEKFKDMDDLDLVDLIKEIDSIYSIHHFNGGKH